MASASDKSRFYLEKLVPELREYERKEIFTKVCMLSKFQVQLFVCEIELGLTYLLD